MHRTRREERTSKAIRTLLAITFVIAGCSRQQPEPSPQESSSLAPAASATTNAANRGVRVNPAGAGDDAAKVIREAREREAAEGRSLVVYVGAPWCEPCQRFHEAAKKGELDGDFPNLSLLEFDLEVDRARLAAAGYESEMIPLFVLPNEDGRASSKRFEGSIKGSGAVRNIAPRLRSLLSK